MRHHVPGPVFRQPKFRFRPVDTEGIDAQKQIKGLAQWASQPVGPRVFIVTAYDQLHSEYATAHFVEHHVKRDLQANVLWTHLWDDKLDRYTGTFRNPVPKQNRNDTPVTIIVCTGIDTRPTAVQCEKVRDLQHLYPTVPLIVSAFGLGISPVWLAKQLLTGLHLCVHITPLRPHEHQS